MKVRMILLLMGSTLFLINCATPGVMKIAAVASPDQNIGYQETITSQKKHLVSISPYTELNKINLAMEKTLFMISVKNDGKEPVNINYKNFSVTFENKTGKGDSIKIGLQDFDDLMNDLWNEYIDGENQKIKSALDDILSYINTAELKYVEKKGHKVSNNVADLDTELAEESIDVVQYNTALRMMEAAQHRSEDLINDIKTMRTNNKLPLLRQTLPELFWKQQTISPGNSYSGVIVCDLHDVNVNAEGNFKVTVLVDGEEHKFIFKRGISK